MKIFLGILKEIGIFIAVLLVLAGAIVIAFKDQLPYEDVIKKGEEYVKADLKEYSVTSSDRIAEVDAVRITHKTNSSQIVEAENDVRIQTGKYTPFGNISGTSNLPTEMVGVTSGSGDEAVSNNKNKGESENELQYPETDDPVKELEKEQSESSESAANRRFNNE